MDRRHGYGALLLTVGIAGACLAQGETPAPGNRLPELPAVNSVQAPRVASSPMSTEQPLRVADAVRIGLASQPDIASAQASLQGARGALRAERSARRPQVTASLSQQASNSFNIIAAPSANLGGGVGGGTGNIGLGGSTGVGVTGSSSIQGSQLLYDFGRTSANIAASRQEVTAAERTVDQARAQVVLNVKNAFYTALQRRRLRVVAERELSDQKAHLEEAQARYKAGLVASGDVARALAAAAAAQSSLAQAQRNEEDARLALNAAMGRDAAVEVTLAEEEENVPEVDANALTLQALAQRPEIKRSRASITAAEERVRAQKKGNLPTINGVAGLSTTNSSYTKNAQGQPFVGFTLNATPFDSGLTRGRVEQAKADVESAKANLRSVELEISRQVLGAYLDVRSAQEQNRATAVEVSSADESLRVAEGRYRAGIATFIEVTDAQATLTDARVRQVNAQAQVSAAVANLLYQLGQPADEAANTPARPTTPFTLSAPVR